MQVIATAGHVDHGKSTLIRALTGMEPDRWAEERRRGMTIDLGYAWMHLPDGTPLAFVDVPGHQRFVSNMLAGVGPVPAVLFVVAADEGWSAQSSEHLDALDALQVRHGVLAITRADLGDADLAAEEAREHLAGTSLAQLPAVAVSPVTGAGMDELRVALEALAGRLPERVDGPTRMWIDRVFTIRGAGTVVTGTLSSGTIRLNDELQVHPSGRRVGIRAIQSLKEQVAEVSGVARVAVNLRGVKPSDVRRGDALTGPGQWLDVSVLDVRLSRPVDPLPTELTLHVGSAAVPVRVRPFGPDTARLTLSRPVPVRIGERGVLRDPGAQRVVAAATVLDPLPPPLTRRGDARRRGAQLAGLGGAPDPAEEVRRRGAVRRVDLQLAGVPVGGELPGVAEVGEWLVEPGRWREWHAQLAAAVADWARTRPMTPGLPRASAMQHLQLADPMLLQALIEDLPELALDAAGIHLRDQVAALPPAAEAEIARIVERLTAAPFAAPELPDLAAAGLTDRHLAVATKTGRLARIAAGIYLLPDAVDEAVRRLAELDQPFTAAQARQSLGTTRRVALPLLELLDRLGRTERIDALLRRVRG